jgi:hypothetical protein
MAVPRGAASLWLPIWNGYRKLAAPEGRWCPDAALCYQGGTRFSAMGGHFVDDSALSASDVEKTRPERQLWGELTFFDYHVIVQSNEIGPRVVKRSL